jgi:nitroreductase
VNDNKKGGNIMNFNDLAKQRYSVRKYKSVKVEEEKIQKILEAGRVAPTAKNLQPQRFLVITDEKELEKFNKVTRHHGAPLVIVICSDRETAWVRPYDSKDMMDIDATIATDHMMMAAQDMGLGSCWITYFDPEGLKKEFNIPDNLEAINILAIGYADDNPKSPDRHDTMRKPLEEMVFYNKF